MYSSPPVRRSRTACAPVPDEVANSGGDSRTSVVAVVSENPAPSSRALELCTISYGMCCRAERASNAWRSGGIAVGAVAAWPAGAPASTIVATPASREQRRRMALRLSTVRWRKL